MTQTVAPPANLILPMFQNIVTLCCPSLPVSIGEIRKKQLMPEQQ